MKFLIAVALALVTVSAKNLHSPSVEVPVFKNKGRITNGKKAAPGEFKYQVGLVFKTGTNFSVRFCGGSLIGNNWVLTVSHCGHGASSVEVYLGATDFTVPEKVYPVPKSDIIIHSEFNPDKFLNDITLIRIPTTSESSRIGIVKIPSNNNNKYVGDSVVASGWGLTSDTSEEEPIDLQYGLLKVSPGSICSEVYPAVFNDELFICAATHNKVSSCHGDSGGPLVLEGHNLQIGLILFGSKHGCAVGRPVAFTSVSAYLSWICSHSKIGCWHINKL